jgi:hypothetical protein
MEQGQVLLGGPVRVLGSGSRADYTWLDTTRDLTEGTDWRRFRLKISESVDQTAEGDRMGSAESSCPAGLARYLNSI